MSALPLATLALGVAAFYWLEAGVSAALGSRRIPRLGRVQPLSEDQLPSLSIVATAKDEAAGVELAARSLLGQDYPKLEIVVVDDRSKDATGEILDRLASEDSRLRVLHVETLPPDWIGKCHALARGAEASSGEWVLFTDGDVVLGSDAVRRAVSLAIGGGWDHVAIGPDMRIESLGEAVFVAAFVVLFNATQKPWLAPDPRSGAAIGIGAFNLVRRSAYERAGGHAAIRYELLDDMALGKILKRSGARQTFARHDGLVSVRWHYGVRGLVRGIEKNAFPAARYSVPLGLIAPPIQLALAFAPYVGFAMPGTLPKLLAGAAWIGVLLAYREAARTGRIHLWQAILMPVGVVLFLYSFMRSMAITLARRGVLWRDTFYPLRELKQRRVW